MMDRVGNGSPVLGAVRQSELRCDSCQAVASRPAHCGRMGMYATPPAEFPDAVVGFEREFASLGAQALKETKQVLVARPRQSPVEKHWHGGQNYTAIAVVLDLPRGGVTDANRPIGTIAVELWRGAFIHRIDRHDAVDWSDGLVWIGHDTQRVGNKFLHCLCGANAIERLDDKISVAQPAIAVIPSAAGAGRFGDRRGMCRDDAAGLLVAAQLQCDGRSDDRILPVVGDRQPVYPLHPIVDGAVAKFAAGRCKIALKLLIRPEQKMQG